MHAPGAEAVAHEQRVQLPVESLHPNPRGKRQRFDLTRHVKAHAVADTLKFERALSGPAALTPLAPHNAGVARRGALLAHVSQLPARWRGVEIEADEQGRVAVEA